jgi:hypothetical protein
MLYDDVYSNHYVMLILSFIKMYLNALYPISISVNDLKLYYSTITIFILMINFIIATLNLIIFMVISVILIQTVLISKLILKLS